MRTAMQQSQPSFGHLSPTPTLRRWPGERTCAPAHQPARPVLFPLSAVSCPPALLAPHLEGRVRSCFTIHLVKMIKKRRLKRKKKKKMKNVLQMEDAKKHQSVPTSTTQRSLLCCCVSCFRRNFWLLTSCGRQAGFSL